VNELIEASLRAPTVVFTIGLGIALFYWLFVLLGALDIDVLGGAEGAGKGLGDVVTGGAKGGAEALEGMKVDGDADGDGGGVWSGLGLGKVPMTISVSLILLVGWCGSLMLSHYALPAMGVGLRWALLPVMLIVGMMVTAVLVRPLGPVFAVKEGKSNRDYVGHTCTVNTGSVDEGFGQATLEDGGTVLQIPVRCDAGKLARGDKALVIDFDERRQAYVVEPQTNVLPASPDDQEA
jgi:hypothetical protein